MGKYMRKAKTAGEVAVMEVTQSTLGVRTRARTLALQRLQASAPPASSVGGGSGSYLQLRSRRLDKPPAFVNDSSRRTKQGQGKEKEEKNSSSGGNSRAARVEVGQGESGSRGSVQKEENSCKNEGVKEVVVEQETNSDVGIEASFGENVLDFEARERSTRESTPCSLIRDPETIRTPGSTTRPTSSIQGRGVQSSGHNRQIPTAHEMDQFFADAEEDQQKQFIEKYNYDPVNDKPLPGQFQWEKFDP